jgi:hypothetical protein
MSDHMYRIRSDIKPFLLISAVYLTAFMVVMSMTGHLFHLGDESLLFNF